ncbi:hypothetical protein XENOCAPTIV_000807 [Xenoophorus captivus]|uniref:Uncharacterized protein n=1 Tax=Xenoophorus captivus TaxID=1517983 RepID=A0ABV0QP30_9TELE
MSFKTVGTLLTLTLRATGNRTPPLARSPRVNRLSTSCRVFAGSQHVEKNKGQSCSSDSDRPNDGDVPLSSEPPHKCGNGDKRLKEAAGAPGASGVRRRSFTSKAAPTDQTSFLWNRYNDLKRLVYGACKSLNSSVIYANNEVSLEEVDIYGFDYDYTLAQYSNELNMLIYDTAKAFLIEHFKGLLMKIDAFHYIEPGTVYRGLSPLSDEEVHYLYGGTFHVPLSQDSGFYGKGNLFDFLRLTGWRGSKVLYFGDHLYSDLAVRSDVETRLAHCSHRPRTGARNQNRERSPLRCDSHMAAGPNWPDGAPSGEQLIPCLHWETVDDDSSPTQKCNVSTSIILLAKHKSPTVVELLLNLNTKGSCTDLQDWKAKV